MMGSLPARTGLLRTLFLALACTFFPILIYNYYTYPVYLKESYTTWLCTAILGFSIHVFALSLWVAYKEANSLRSAIWIFLMYWTGSVTTGSYIFIQFLKLSPEESAQDPIYHVLLRPEHKGNEKRKREKKTNKSSSVVLARTAFILLACSMIAAVIYSAVTVGSPFRMEVLFSQWMVATVIDCSFLSLFILVWIAHKEASWSSVSLWIILYICLGSLATCAYMIKQLFQLSCQDPLYIVLVKRNNRVAKRTYTTVPPGSTLMTIKCFTE